MAWRGKPSRTLRGCLRQGAMEGAQCRPDRLLRHGLRRLHPPQDGDRRHRRERHGAPRPQRGHRHRLLRLWPQAASPEVWSAGSPLGCPAKPVFLERSTSGDLRLDWKARTAGRRKLAKKAECGASDTVGYGLTSESVTDTSQDSLWKAVLYALRDPGGARPRGERRDQARHGWPLAAHHAHRGGSRQPRRDRWRARR